MAKMRKVFSAAMAAVMAMSLTACGSSAQSAGTAQASSAEAASSSESAGSSSAASSDQKFTVGICQLVQHEALDAATKGFKDVLTETYGDRVTFDEQNASGDPATCSTIVNTFASNGVDLILANATPSLQAAASATSDIPILGTAVTEYGEALGIDGFDGTVGKNISGTSDLAPLDQQAAMFDELLPDAKKIGILYCSAEHNSVYQGQKVKEALEESGHTVQIYTFADSNDVAQVTQTACGENDALYIPTDNTAASCTGAINNVAQPAGIPIITGEEGLAKGCGIATLSISYYELGRTTGEMAVKILNGEADIKEMPVEYYANPVKKYNKTICDALGVTVPDEYEAIEE